MDRFYTMIRDGRVLLGPRFSVNSELKRFAPRAPGQPLDGIAPLRYPPRFSTQHGPPGATS
jgi:menaquinol-cytochrome c reductase iron-sulfur subunit